MATLAARVTALAQAVAADVKAILASLGDKAGKGANSDITSLSGLTTPLSVAQGGTGNTNGNAATATKLATARTLSWSGDVTGSTTYDGSGNSSAALTLAGSGVIAGSYAGLTVNAKGLVTSATATGVSFNNSLNVTSTTGNAGLRFGNQSGMNSTPYFDFLSGGNNINYDFRLIAKGGSPSNTTSGTGQLSMLGSALNVGTESPISGSMLSVNGPVAFAGPGRVGQYTLTSLPSASAFNGFEIDVTNAAGGPKRCRSDGTNWKIINTTTTVS